jgi:hypothetical protein
MKTLQKHHDEPALSGKANGTVSAMRNGGRGAGWLAVICSAAALPAGAQSAAAEDAVKAARQRSNLPPRVVQAQRFLAQRGWTETRAGGRVAAGHPRWRASAAETQSQTPATATWQALGPAAVITPEFGLVTGRVSALALDPLNTGGNCLYVGTTGGGVWVASNAGAATASVVLNPLTDAVGALSGAQDASISIGALTVQAGTVATCGATGVILAGTGDPNDNLDSYYGAGILRSADGGQNWSLISRTVDVEEGLSGQDYSFAGEGFAGFAWSTANPQLVVAAVSQAREGTLVDADRPTTSYEGLYYSSDSGATWHLATITDGSGADVQGPAYRYLQGQPDGNAATAVVWNPVRNLFMAAVRYHGFYQSQDGVTWTRMAVQPGVGLTTSNCPANQGSLGSQGCPIFRGALAVNPQTGDTFAWYVDVNNQDQGLWEDQCAGACASQSIAFATRLATALLETSTNQGAATIENGDYTLALAAVPVPAPDQQDTALLAGDNDLWKCTVMSGCVWRNTTNAGQPTCAAGVGEFQHALGWGGAGNPQEIFVGNDSGLWRSMDAIGETGSACAATDSQHFQNLNGSFQNADKSPGSLAEVMSMSQVITTPYTMMTGLGTNGTAGVKSGTGPTADWPLILNGEGGPVAIDPRTTTNWYANNWAGVSIYKGTPPAGDTPGTFSPVLSYSADALNEPEVVEDGLTMPAPAPFLVDPVDPEQLLIGTCRLWRGPANGIGWSTGNANAISTILDSPSANGPCAGDALIRTMAAAALPGGGEVVYLGMYGSASGNTRLPGHVWSVTYSPVAGVSPVWQQQDLTLNPLTNDSKTMNAYGMDISSIFIDPRNPTGNAPYTVYVTVEGIASLTEEAQMVYSSTDAGAHWTNLTGNLPWAAANSVVVDPQDANTVYLATDAGVYFTTQVGSCANLPPVCWSAFGTGLPAAPVVELSAAPLTASVPVLAAATYGRGVWQTPLWTSETGLTTVIASPSPLAFTTPAPVSTASTLTVTLLNTGTRALTMPASETVIGGENSGDFKVTTDNCRSATVQSGGNCAIMVTFSPSATGSRMAQMTIYANIYGGQLTVELSGTGTPAEKVTLTPVTLSFGVAPGQTSQLPTVPVNSTSAPQQVEAGNSSSTPVAISNVAVTAPFLIASNSCGTSTLAAGADCQVMVEFAPTQRGAATGTLTFTDGAGTQTVLLSGWASAPATDTLNPTALSFPGTIIGQIAAAQTVSLTNSGDLPLTGISINVSGPFTELDNCNGQLAANSTSNSSCAISVQYVPTVAGTQTGTLTVADVTRSQPQTVALSGTGLLPPEFTVTPLQLTFPAALPGQASAAQTVTVTNGGSIAATALNLAVAAPFSLTQDNCTGNNLAAGANCTAGVIFTPTASGTATGILTITSASVSNPALVALSGTGAVPFDFTVAVSGSNPQTVSSGQTAYFPLVITPLNVTQGTLTFNLQCTTPAGSELLCLFNPSQNVPVSAGAIGNVTVQISTGQSGSSALSTGLSRWRELPLVCGLVLLPLAWRRRRNALLLAALLAIAAGGVTSCASSGGGSGGSPSSPTSVSGSTPAGKYPVSVIVACNGVQQPITLTLIVD